MEIRIPNNQIRPLIKESYPKIYDGLCKLLAPDELIFAPWNAGFGGLLQWDLPDDLEWKSYAQASPVEQAAIIDEYKRQMEIGRTKLGNNQQLVERVYSVPSSDNIYYAFLPDGSCRIVLTAWGYSYPYKAPATAMTLLSEQKRQNVVLRLVRFEAPAAGERFDILLQNNMKAKHVTDTAGEKTLGTFVEGTRIPFVVVADNTPLEIVVEDGRVVYEFDLTPAQQETPDPEPEPAPESTPEPEPSPEPQPVEAPYLLKFVDPAGTPLAGLNVSLTTPNGVVAQEVVPADGIISLGGERMPFNAPVALNAITTDNNALEPQQLSFTPEEHEYLIEYAIQGKSKLWLEILLVALKFLFAFLVIFIFLDKVLRMF